MEIFYCQIIRNRQRQQTPAAAIIDANSFGEPHMACGWGTVTIRSEAPVKCELTPLVLG